MVSKFLSVFIFVLGLSLVGAVSATVSVVHPVKLMYDNGSFEYLPSGNYEYVNKVDNVWYVGLGGDTTSLFSGSDWQIVVLIVMLVASFVSFFFFNRVPILVYFVGLFAFLSSLYFALAGLWSSNLVVGVFGLFVLVVSGLVMVLTGLGVRVRR